MTQDELYARIACTLLAGYYDSHMGDARDILEDVDKVFALTWKKLPSNKEL